MSTLAVQIFDTPSLGYLIEDATYRIQGLKFGTNKHGFAALSGVIPMTLTESFRLYDRAGLPHIIVSAAGTVVWEGRIEDVAIVTGGVRIGAFGYSRALSDTLYSGAFSATSAQTIVTTLITSVTGTNSTQLSTATGLIGSPGTTYNDSYDDARPADILDRLANAGDTSGNLWEWGVYEGRVLFFRARGSAGRAWYVDATDVQLERSLDKLYNSAYGVYSGTSTKVRTATATDAFSIARYGLTRQGAAGTNVRDAAAAQAARDTLLATYKTANPRATLKYTRVYDQSGAAYPLWVVRAGDTLTVRNLPPTSVAGSDITRTFNVLSTSYDVDGDALDTETSTDTPTIVNQVAAGSSIQGSAAGGFVNAVPPTNIISPFLALPGLVGFWPMSSVQRSTGAAYDVSGQGRTLTYNGNPAYSYVNNTTAILTLDGTGDYLSRADETDLDVLGSETIYNSSVRGLTVLGWVNLTSLAALSGIIGKTNSTGNQRSWVLYYSSANARLEFAVSSAGTAYDVVVAGPAISSTTWYFLACRMIPSTQSDMYVGTTQYANATGPIASLFNSTAALELGAFDGAANYLTGYLGPWALCANALNAAAIASVYQQTRGAFGV